MRNYSVPKNRKRGDRGRIIVENPLMSFLLCLAVFVIGIALAGLIALKLYLVSLPPIKNLNTLKPNIVTTFCAADGEVIKTFAAYTYSNVELKDVPQQLVKALIATEDKNFYKHQGYDLFGLARSMVANVLAGHVVQGASTITQQLSRILFLSNEKTFTRKIKELQVASQIEKTISKDKILEMYLNNVYLGSGAYGVKGAAKIYFNKELSQLTLPEMALIAGLPQAPSVYSPYHNKELAKKRRNQVLLRMYKMKYIDKHTYEASKETPIVLSTMPIMYATNKAPYFCDYVMKELQKLGFSEDEIVNGGLKVVTTLDYKAQIKANEAILSNLKAWGMTKDKNQAAVFSFSPIDGRILVYAGGKDYTKSQYDRVSQSQRPSGSAFKPFIYTAAIEKGFSPNDMIDDMPVKIGNWTPRNYGNKYRGKIPIYTALMVSSNVCAARLMDEIGVRPVIQLARVMGLTTPIPYDYTIALGSNSVKLFEMTRAFGVFANGGYKVEPYAIERVESSRGTILYESRKARTSKVLNINTAATMTAIMRTVITSGTGRAADIGKPAAGKTGTTDDSKDAYFIGFTPDVATGVWVGNDDNSQMGGITGGTIPAKIWHDVMIVATQPYGNANFEYPEVVLNPFRAASVSVIQQGDFSKAEEETAANDENTQTEDVKITPPQMTPSIVRPYPLKSDSSNSNSVKKETPTIDVPIERVEPPVNNFAPVPMQSAPIGQ